MLPAGAFAGWDLHPLESAAFSRRTQIAVIPRGWRTGQIDPITAAISKISGSTRWCGGDADSSSLSVDAGEDAHFDFADLGNAVRKVYIDLGIRIRFDGLRLMKNRPSATLTDEELREIPYYAIGVLEYGAADGDEDGGSDGTILYIKPALHRTEAAGIISYAEAHPDFPHETTSDQWFTESQFESHRSLGFEITERILSTKITLPGQSKITLQELLAKLPETTRAAESAGSPTPDA